MVVDLVMANRSFVAHRTHSDRGLAFWNFQRPRSTENCRYTKSQFRLIGVIEEENNAFVVDPGPG